MPNSAHDKNQIGFRHVRNSRDGTSWLGLAIAVPSCAAWAYVVWDEHGTWRTICTAILFILVVAVLSLLRSILFPHQLELVVDGNSIRWGRVDRPGAQKRIFISDIRKLVHNQHEDHVFADTGGLILKYVGHTVLVSPQDQNAFVGYMSRTFPDLKIETVERQIVG